MDPDRWALIKKIFADTCDATLERRTAILDMRCGADIELRNEVAAMLAKDRDHTGFPVPPMSLGIEWPEQELKQLGPFRLPERIGCGGQGIVYRAQRTDGVYDKIVAIKIMNSGLDPDTTSRFAQDAIS